MKKKNNSDQTDKKRQMSVFERMSKSLDIDGDMICRGFSVELKGKNHVEICGVRRILTYADNEVSFVTSDGIFFVCGKRLYCVSYKRGAVIVEGEICHMGFDNGGKNGTA